MLLDHDDYLPQYVLITSAKKPDVKVAHLLSLNPRSIVVMDMGYIDYKLYAKWTKAGIFFVTRLRYDLNWTLDETRAVPSNRNILEDQIIRFNSQWGRRDCGDLQFRRIVVDIQGEEPLVFLTNHLEFGSTTIADIYKDRWQIEVFFKTLKQNLKIKSFVGDQSQCHIHPDLDSFNRDTPFEVVASPLQSQMVLVQPGSHAPTEFIYLSGFARLAGCPLLHATNTAPGRSVASGVCLIWTAVFQAAYRILKIGTFAM